MLKDFLNAAGRAAVILLSAVGAIFLIGSTIAWMRGEDIVIANQSRPAIVVFLLSWLAIVVVYVIAARWHAFRNGNGKA